MKKLRIAVIGVGYLGKFHAEKYKMLPDVELVFVVDVNLERAKEVAEQLGVTYFTQYADLIGKVDAVSIAVPTQLHFSVAECLLSHGIHVLVEKPMTVMAQEAQILVDIANEHHVVLQVGHLERFNAVIQAISPLLKDPVFIESHRIAPFNLRGSDVCVILDLMIHDIDLIQNMVNSPIARIDANGASVLSDSPDIANVRINFENGCVANVTASRISMKTERKMRIFQHDAYFSLDLHNRKATICRKGEGEHPLLPGMPNIDIQEQDFEKNDALLEEIKAFIFSILNRKSPIVSGVEGKRSLETAIKISNMIQASQKA